MEGTESTLSQAEWDWDVVVVGLGPVGTTLCGLLARQGLKVLGIDRENSVYGLPRAGHMDHSILRTLSEIGVLDAALAEMIPNHGLELRSGEGKVLARIPVATRTPSGLPSSMHFHQPTFDRILREGVDRMPNVTLRNSVRLVDFKEVADGVAIKLEAPEGEVKVRSRFIVGCDGASSGVRTKAGLGMRDYGFEESWMVVDLILRNVPPTLARDTVFGADPRRPYAMIELPGMRYRFEFMLLPHEDATVVVSEDIAYGLIAPWVQRGDIQAIERTIVYTFRGMQAEHWCRGNVAIAGDAAHLTPPFLGQGLCSGVRDAANLAWKIGAALRGDLPRSILESYQAERGPHVDNVIRTSITLGKNLCILDPKAAAERDDALLNGGEPEEARIRFKLGELEPGAWVMKNGGMYVMNDTTPQGSLDEILGSGFGVIARSEAALDGHEDLIARLKAKFLTLDKIALPMVEKFMTQKGMNVLVVRPDKYVLGGGTSMAEVAAHLAQNLQADDLERPVA